MNFFERDSCHTCIHFDVFRKAVPEVRALNLYIHVLSLNSFSPDPISKYWNLYMHVLHSHFRLNFAANITRNQDPQQLTNARGQRTQIVQQAWASLWKSAPFKRQMGKRGNAGNWILHPFCTGYKCTDCSNFFVPVFFFSTLKIKVSSGHLIALWKKRCGMDQKKLIM